MGAFRWMWITLGLVSQNGLCALSILKYNDVCFLPISSSIKSSYYIIALVKATVRNFSINKIVEFAEILTS